MIDENYKERIVGATRNELIIPLKNDLQTFYRLSAEIMLRGDILSEYTPKLFALEWQNEDQFVMVYDIVNSLLQILV